MDAPVVLCADDDGDIRNLVRATLTTENIRVVLAINGGEAIELALRHRPGAIVLDLAMPFMDGLQALGWLKSRPEVRHIPVMMLTADSHTENVHAAIAAGARDYLVKPFEPAELRARVRRLLSGELRDEPSPDTTNPRTAGARREGSPWRILAIVRQPAMRAVIEGMLRDRYAVDLAPDVDRARTAAERNAPDVVLIDMALPDPGSILLTLAALPGVGGVRSIALDSARGSLSNQPALYDEIIRGGFTREALVAAIDRLLDS